MPNVPLEKLSPAERLARQPPAERAKFLKGLTDEQARTLLYQWRGFRGRPAQVAPAINPRTGHAFVFWLLLAGRGYGKTRTAAEWIRERVDHGAKEIIMAGATSRDVRKVIVEGESGILAISPPWNRPIYEPSKLLLTWPNGARAHLCSGEEPDRFRGLQCDTFWCDELAAWQYPNEAWEMLLYGFRLGDNYGVLPQGIVSTTPRPIPIIRSLRDNPDCFVTRGSSWENRSNLTKTFFSTVIQPRMGTRLGRQEIDAEILDDHPGALWKLDTIDRSRVRVLIDDKTGKRTYVVKNRLGEEAYFAELPQFVRIVVSIDPAVSNNADSNETGIIVAGLTADGDVYILEDASGTYSPEEWAQKAADAYVRWEADFVIGEVNNGGDLVRSNLRHAKLPKNERLVYRQVRASRGKAVRAEPVATRYEQLTVHHVGSFPKLEDQMTTWDPREGHEVVDESADTKIGSPDRMDALVWAVVFLTQRSYGSKGGNAPTPQPRGSFESRSIGGP